MANRPRPFYSKIGETTVWIIPNNKAKQAVEKTLGKRFSRNDFSWWNIRFDLGKEIEPTTITDYPDQYSILPTDLTGPWGRYLPMIAWSVTISLYSEMTKGGVFRKFSNLADVLDKIQKGIEHSQSPSHDLQASFHDRELLIKELCDYNSLTYPVDSTTMLEFLQQIGFIQVNQSQGQIEYLLTGEIINPQKLLKMPKKWEERMDKFLTNGSVLFSYLSVDEIVKNQ